MILKRIYLKNFLAHTETEINFPDKGITVFIGENGAGKSSIIEGISFALYGKTSKGNLQDLVQWGKNESKIELDFIKGQEIYRIERIISIKGKKTLSTGTVYKKKGDRFLPYYQKNISKEIPKITGFTLKTFFSSVLIRQGEIESIIEMRPRERAKLFEEILDMSLYQLISEYAAEKRRQIESQIKFISSTVPDIDQIKKDLDILESKKEKIYKVKENIENTKKDIEKKLENLKNRYEEYIKEKEEILRIKNKIGILEEKIKSCKESIKTKQEEIRDIERKEKEISDLESYVKRYEDLERIIEIFRKLEKENERLKAVKDKVNDIKERKNTEKELKKLAMEYEEKEKALKDIHTRITEISKLKGEIKSFEERYEELKTKLSESMKNAQSIAKDLISYKKLYNILIHNPIAVNQLIHNCEQDIKRYEEQIKDLLRKKTEIEAEGKELKRKKEKISSLEGSCPTCERPLDEHSKKDLINEINEKLEELRKRYRKVKEKEKKISELLEKELYIKERLQEYKEYFLKHKEAEEESLKIRSRIFVNQKKIKELKDLEKKKSEIEKFLSENREKYLRYREAVIFLSRIDIEKLENELKNVEKKVNSLKKDIKNEDPSIVYKEYKELKKKVERYFSIREQISKKDDLENQIRTLKNDLKKFSEEIKTIIKSVKETDFIEKEIIKLKKEIEGIEEKLKYIQEEKTDLEKEIASLDTEILIKKKEIEKAEEINKNIRLNKEKAEKYRKIEKVLGPEGIQKVIRDTALYELPKLTNQIFSIFGFPFQQVRFSENFDISLLVPSIERKDRYITVNAISGGQRTALGIALRLSIGRFLSSKNEILILDEPTVHLDEQRRSELINLLLELKRKNFVRQLIIVTHDTEVEDAADSIYYVETGKVKSID